MVLLHSILLLQSCSLHLDISSIAIEADAEAYSMSSRIGEVVNVEVSDGFGFIEYQNPGNAWENVAGINPLTL